MCIDDRDVMKSALVILVLIVLVLPTSHCHTVELTRTSCQPGWSQFSGRCYRRLDDYHLRDECQADCLREGGALASVHSEEENAFIRSLLGLSLIHI